MILDVSSIIQCKEVELLMVSHAPSVPQVTWLATPQRDMGDVCICLKRTQVLELQVPSTTKLSDNPKLSFSTIISMPGRPM